MYLLVVFFAAYQFFFYFFIDWRYSFVLIGYTGLLCLLANILFHRQMHCELYQAIAVYLGA